MNHYSLAQKYAKKCILGGVEYSLKIVIILIFQVLSHSSSSFCRYLQITTLWY